MLYRENLDEAQILAALDPLFGAYAAERGPEERFGDYLWRSRRVGAPEAPAAAPAT